MPVRTDTQLAAEAIAVTSLARARTFAIDAADTIADLRKQVAALKPQPPTTTARKVAVWRPVAPTDPGVQLAVGVEHGAGNVLFGQYPNALTKATYLIATDCRTSNSDPAACIMGADELLANGWAATHLGWPLRSFYKPNGDPNLSGYVPDLGIAACRDRMAALLVAKAATFAAQYGGNAIYLDNMPGNITTLTRDGVAPDGYGTPTTTPDHDWRLRAALPTIAALARAARDANVYLFTSSGDIFDPTIGETALTQNTGQTIARFWNELAKQASKPNGVFVEYGWQVAEGATDASGADISRRPRPDSSGDWRCNWQPYSDLVGVAQGNGMDFHALTEGDAAYGRTAPRFAYVSALVSGMTGRSTLWTRYTPNLSQSLADPLLQLDPKGALIGVTRQGIARVGVFPGATFAVNPSLAAVPVTIAGSAFSVPALDAIGVAS